MLGDPILKTDELTGRDVHATFFGDRVTDQADRASGAEESAVPAVQVTLGGLEQAHHMPVRDILVSSDGITVGALHVDDLGLTEMWSTVYVDLEQAASGGDPEGSRSIEPPDGPVALKKADLPAGSLVWRDGSPPVLLNVPESSDQDDEQDQVVDEGTGGDELPHASDPAGEHDQSDSESEGGALFTNRENLKAGLLGHGNLVVCEGARRMSSGACFGTSDVRVCRIQAVFVKSNSRVP